MASLVLLLSELLHPEDALSVAIDRLPLANSSLISKRRAFSGERVAAETKRPLWRSPETDRKDIGDNLQELRVSVESIWS
ncbi:hypothetical protein IEQ34_006022 [Dendrobium chrysotoxum]|uniref:Uncharacterized protein n=1 Tax=Dendrobium chrysotoxum TaxID=161865 RepID=A0AAV7HDU2_DENCH|nr:hypothetical protein IEQ34_006022 [Dendrobium chrysotoxum]